MENKFQSENVGDLFAALAKAQGEMQHASKGVLNDFTKKKYADLTAVIDASRECLAKNGLSINHFTDISDDGSVTLICQMSHSSGQWMRGWYPIRPVKGDPQGYGSALTYARRYTYSAMVGVVVIDEDDDGNDASDTKPKTENGNLKTKPQSKPEPKELPAYSDESFNANKNAWAKAIKEKTTTPEKLINTISTKYVLTEQQQKDIRALEGDSNGNS